MLCLYPDIFCSLILSFLALQVFQENDLQSSGSGSFDGFFQETQWFIGYDCLSVQMKARGRAQ